jgi:hypothetical protein
MGVFDVHCTYSGVPLSGDVQVILMQRSGDGWTPLSAPLRSTYDRYGAIDEPDATPAFDAFVRWAKETFDVDGHEEAFETMRDGDAKWEGAEIGYALVDAAVYDALPVAVSAADARLPDALRVPWKTALAGTAPIDLDEAGQYTGYAGEYGAGEAIVRARERFADAPAVLAAIELNAERWRELDE